MPKIEVSRRALLKSGATVAGAGAASMLIAPSANASTSERGRGGRATPRMVIATARRATTVQDLQDFKQLGVEQVCGFPPDPPYNGGSGRGYWTLDEVEQTKTLIESQGLQMNMVALPFLGSTLIDTDPRPAIMQGKSPERDRDIDDIHKMIAVCAQAGVSTIKYNMSILGVMRTGTQQLRGGSYAGKFVASELDHSLPDTIAGKVTPEVYWDRITYFLDRVIPVAEQYKVQMACHPEDPGTPPGGYRGVSHNVLSVPGGEGLFRFLRTHPSRYHGLNLCCGTLAEMLWNPKEEIYEIVYRLAKTGRVFNVHLRNIKGRRDNFYECWPDEGDVDETRVISALAEGGYSGGVDPDHIPHGGNASEAFAQGYGYLLGAIKAAAHRDDRRWR